MNPLTLVKRIQQINSKEAALGISEEASWHAKYKDSAYVFVGGIPFDLTEGDLLAVFAQYGEVVDVNLVRDKGTGKSKGFAFVAYEDQRSTNLAVDNLNGAQILGRIIRVDHVTKYKKKEEEDEETQRKKREERGVCRAFQKGECTRGDSCKFSHDEQRAANTGWGPEDAAGSRWGNDKFDGPKWGEKRSDSNPSKPVWGAKNQDGFRQDDKDFPSRSKGSGRALESNPRVGGRREEKRLGRHEDDEFEPKSREDHDRRQDTRLERRNKDEFESRSRERKREEKGSRKQDVDDFRQNPREGSDCREEKRQRRNDVDEFQPKSREDAKEERRSRRHGDEFDGKEGKRSRRQEDDASVLKSREDGREGKTSRRYESDYRGEEKRDKGGDMHRDSTSRSYRGRDEHHRHRSDR